MLNTLTAYTGTDRSLEFNVEIMQNPQTVGAIMDFCEREHETPVSVTVLSEENTEYDIIGILSDKPLYVRPEAGEWLPEEGGGFSYPTRWWRRPRQARWGTSLSCGPTRVRAPSASAACTTGTVYALAVQLRAAGPGGLCGRGGQHAR